MKHSGLQIDQDMDFQRREWRVQRIGICLMVVFVIAALLGITGMGGVASHASASDAGGHVNVEYERFVRRNARSRIVLTFNATAGDVRVAISGPYLEKVALRSVFPQPESIVVERDRRILLFRASSPGFSVAAEIEPLVAGSLEADIGISDGPAVHFRQWSIF